MRRFRLLALALLPLACGSSTPVCGDGVVDPPEACDEGALNATAGHCKADCSGVAAPPAAKVSITGDVFAFMKEVPGPRVSGAVISVLEQPDKTATTGADGHFEIDGLDAGSDVTLVMSHPDFYPTQSATYTLGPNGIHPFAIQALSTSLFKALSGLFTNLEQDTHCVLATTVTRLGGTLHVMVRQGEPGAALTISPAAADTMGPVYFGENVLPDMSLTATTKDGGALYYHVLPGDYVVSAQKDGVTFSPVKMKCRAGFLVNAGPPIGLQANADMPDWGASGAADTYSASTDAMCEKTAACVNAKNGMGAYPQATVDGCKATFRRALSFVDVTCDASVHVRDAWKAFFECRAADCSLTLGDDTACATEEKAYVDAMAVYAPCFTAAHHGK
jgi:hypothetical protein